MTTSGPVAEGKAIAVRTAAGTQTVTVPEAIPPKGMEEGEAEKIRAQAREILEQLMAAEESVDELDVLRRISTLGKKSQVLAAEKFTILQVKVRDYMRQDRPEDAMERAGKDIVTLRQFLDEISPGKFRDASSKSFISRVVPDSLQGNPLFNALKRWAIKYETISQQIAIIEGSLRAHARQLDLTSAELVVFLRDLQAARRAIARNAFLAFVLMGVLNNKIQEIGQDPAMDSKATALGDGLYRASICATSLSTMNQLYVQNDLGMTTTARSLELVKVAIDDMLTLGMNLVTAGIVNEMALRNQRDAIRAYQGVRTFIGEQAVRNARMLNEQIVQIGDINKNPLAMFEKIQEAHGQLMTAVENLERMRMEVVQQAAERVPQLDAMTRQIEDSKEGIRKELLLSGVESLEAEEDKTA